MNTETAVYSIWTTRPFEPFHLITFALFVIVTGLYFLDFIIGTLFRKHSARAALTGLFTTIFTSASAFLFFLAVMNPTLTSVQDDQRSHHLVVVLDASDSIQRIAGGWDQATQITYDFLASSLDSMPTSIKENATASVVTFREQPSASGVVPIPQILNLVRSATINAVGDGTNIEAGLTLAEAQIRANGGRGEILLVTDGNQTGGDAEKAAQLLSQRGIPVTIIPLTSAAPAVGINSVFLPPQVESDGLARYRLVTLTASTTTTPFRLQLINNTGMQLEQDALIPAEFSILDIPFQLAAEKPLVQSFEIPITGIGLQYTDAILRSAEGEMLHQRRLYTNVTRPIRLLGIGGDFEWVRALSPDFAEVTQIRPTNFDESLSLNEFDALVLSAVPAGEFTSNQLSRITEAVSEEGLGLMIFNGDHGNAPDDAPSVLRSYHDTPVDDLFPIETDTRLVTEPPPPRNIVILIDASGSMENWRIDMARTIASYIVDPLLRRDPDDPTIDHLDVLAFTNIPLHLVENREMTANGRNYAIDQISRITAEGPTNPESALALIRSRNMSNCGLFFLSDGDFNIDFRGQVGRHRPDCRTTVFSINELGVPTEDIAAFAEPINVLPGFDVSQLQLSFFHPEERNKFFERGEIIPYSQLGFGECAYGLEFVELPISGAAISTLRDDPEREVCSYAMSPFYKDPILVYGEAGNGHVGVFTGGLNQTWTTSRTGQRSVESWLRLVVANAERDRYAFRIEDRGQLIQLEIQVQPRDQESATGQMLAVPQVRDLQIRLNVEGQEYTIDMIESPDQPGAAVFVGDIDIERTEFAQRGTLTIEEVGPPNEILLRPQRIPIAIPPADGANAPLSQEAYSYGLNESLLTQVARITGGSYNPMQGYNFFSGILLPDTEQSFWYVPLIAGAGAYLIAIFLQKHYV